MLNAQIVGKRDFVVRNALSAQPRAKAKAYFSVMIVEAYLAQKVSVLLGIDLKRYKSQIRINTVIYVDSALSSIRIIVIQIKNVRWIYVGCVFKNYPTRVT